MKKITLSLLIIFAGKLLPAQVELTTAPAKNISFHNKIRLSGKITDVSTGAPLPGASVYVADDKTGTSADANGKYVLTNIPAGHHILEISHTGYNTIVEHIELTADLEKDFALSTVIIENQGVIVTGVAGATSIRKAPVPVSSVRKAALLQTPSSNIIDALSFADSPFVVIRADLRGTGETEDRAEFNDPKYYNREYRNAMLALHIGKPMVGQRTTDLLTIFDFILSDKRLKNLPIEVHASAPSAVSLLHAALWSTNIESIHITHGPKSYLELLQNPAQKDWYSNVIPNVLKYYDLPDLIKLIGESKVW